ncbi:MAG TPA: GNAT family N-acetyltransferase [Bryobacteraceae bacterium]|nr:GNAT family N-acetyltransferase [Bryobacteraceae bacterium]
MPLEFRLARPSDYDQLEQLTIDSFEPITWLKRADQHFGPLNGHDWRNRWQLRFRKAFDTQQVLVGEDQGEIVAFASGTVDPDTLLGFIDLLGVDTRHQGKGYGRAMLRGMLQFMKSQGAVHCSLECLTDNDKGNSLYRAEGFEEVARSIRWFIKIP